MGGGLHTLNRSVTTCQTQIDFGMTIDRDVCYMSGHVIEMSCEESQGLQPSKCVAEMKEYLVKTPLPPPSHPHPHQHAALLIQSTVTSCNMGRPCPCIWDI